jgi:O-antigen/teichoic acid export membrane protein
MSMKRQVTLGVIWAATGSWGREAAGLVVFLVLARLLTPEAYGLVGMATVVIAIAQALVSDLLQVPLIQRQDLEPGHLDTAFWSLLGLAVSLMLAAMAAAGPVATFFGEPEVATLVRWLSPLPVLNALAAVQTALLKREIRQGVLAARSLLAVVAGGSVGVSMALTDQGAFSLVGHLLTQAFVGTLVLWTACDWRPGWRVSRRHFRDLRISGFFMIGIRLSVLLEQQSPRVLIGYLLGPVAVGLYTVSWRILEILWLIAVLPLNEVALPVFSRLQDDLERFRQLLYSVRQLSAMVALPIFAGLAVVAPELLPALLGHKWQAAIPVVQLFALQGVSIAIVTITPATVLQALGRWGLALGVSLLATALTVSAIILGSQKGLVGVAAGMAFVAYLMVPIELYVERRLTEMRLSKQALAYAPIASAIVIMAAAVIGWRELMATVLEPLPLLATSVLLGAATYAVVLWLIAKPLVRQAWQLFASLRQKSRMLDSSAGGEVS